MFPRADIESDFPSNICNIATLERQAMAAAQCGPMALYNVSKSHCCDLSCANQQPSPQMQPIHPWQPTQLCLVKAVALKAGHWQFKAEKSAARYLHEIYSNSLISSSTKKLPRGLKKLMSACASSRRNQVKRQASIGKLAFDLFKSIPRFRDV